MYQGDSRCSSRLADKTQRHEMINYIEQSGKHYRTDKVEVQVNV